MRASNERTGRIWRALRRVMAAAVVVFAIVAAPARAATQPPPPAQEGFVPVEQAGKVQEQLPAAPLVMGAYAVAWIAILIYLWSIWQRLGRVEQEIAAVHRRLEARR